MRVVLPPKSRRFTPLRAGATLAFSLLFISLIAAQQPEVQAPAPSARQSREPGPPSRIPHQQAFFTAALDGVVREQIPEASARPIPAAKIQLRELATGKVSTALTSGDGAFRILLLAPGAYQASVEADGYATLQIASLVLNANEVLTLEIFLVSSADLEVAFAASTAARTRPATSRGKSCSDGFLSRVPPSPRFRSKLHSRTCARCTSTSLGSFHPRSRSLGSSAARLSPLLSSQRVHLRKTSLVRSL